MMYTLSIHTITSNFAKAKKTVEWEARKESFAVLVGARLITAENICNMPVITYH